MEILYEADQKTTFALYLYFVFELYENSVVSSPDNYFCIICFDLCWENNLTSLGDISDLHSFSFRHCSQHSENNETREETGQTVNQGYNKGIPRSKSFFKSSKH